MNKTITIEGMSCMHCSAAVQNALKGINGVSNAVVDLEKKNAFVEAEASVTDEMLRTAVEDAGYEVKNIS